MPAPLDLTDIFPAFALGGVALLNLMARLDPPPIVRWGISALLGLLLALYLLGQIHLYLPDSVGVPVYGVLVLLFGGVIWWNWRDKRATNGG